MSTDEIDPMNDYSVDLSVLTPFVDYLANVSSESQFLIELERLIGESAPELISGNVDVYLTAVIDHYERRPDPDLLSKYSKCRERFRKYRSARPELQLLNPTHTEGESNRNMRDEVLSFTNVEDIVDYANDFPLILTEESLAEWKPHAELFRHSDQWHHLTLLHGERLGVLQLLQSLHKQLPTNAEVLKKQLLKFIWMKASDVFAFLDDDPTFLIQNPAHLLKKASLNVTDNDTRLIVTLRRNLVLQAEYQGKERNPDGYENLEMTILNRCQGDLELMLEILEEVGLRHSAQDLLDIQSHQQTGAAIRILTPIELEVVQVPAGEFLMGSDPLRDSDAERNEQPQHTIYLDEYFISKYPITNAQYAGFVYDTGHPAPQNWPRNKLPDEQADYPVVFVRLQDALEFCNWLTRKTQYLVRLPSEAEWEKAARGPNGRIYPWGDHFDSGSLNPYSALISVGRYSPEGDSPYGCSDMAGLIWEWTRSIYKPYPYDAKDGRENPDPNLEHVVRGSGFFSTGWQIHRCAVRGHPNVNQGATDGVGFRVVFTSKTIQKSGHGFMTRQDSLPQKKSKILDRLVRIFRK